MPPRRSAGNTADGSLRRRGSFWSCRESAGTRPAPILDGNITRLLCRWRGIREDTRSPRIQKKLWGLSEQLVLEESPGEFNQALMELGALVCTPRRPRCLTCPVRKDCRARKLGLQDRIPMPRRHAPRRRIRYLCGILERNGSLLLARRPLSGLLPGLWELPGGERSPGESEAEGLARNLRERLGLQVEPTGLRLRAEVEQTLTHRELQIRAFSCRWKGRPRPQGYPEVRWAPKRSLNQLPLTTGMRRVADQL
ncbi:MAG: NUDIX domain-containing protein [Candidatus Omnitrophica bacterium]|nr:NUDIX domain-containing protein [Candidatus Omnitrophota bacterium]